MKLFNESSPSLKKAENQGVKNTRKSKKASRPELSDDQIRQKISQEKTAQVETSKLAQVKNQMKLGEGFLNQEVTDKKMQEQIKIPESAPEIKTPNTSDYTVRSDVGLNNPLDSNTSEKLKTVLSKGAFNFNSKERGVLEKILGEA